MNFWVMKNEIYHRGQPTSRTLDILSRTYHLLDKINKVLSLIMFNLQLFAPCGLQGCKNWPAPFPGRMLYKATKPGLALSVISKHVFIVLWFIRAPFYVLLVFVVCVLSLVVLVKLSLLAKWLARKTPLRKPNRGEGIISIKPRLKSTLYCVGLLCLTAWYLCCFPGPTWYTSHFCGII